MNSMEKILNRIAIEVEAQYMGQPSPWSDVHSEISSKGPVRNPDSEDVNGLRGYTYESIEGDLVSEWGENYGVKPMGTETEKQKKVLIVKEICNKCKGDGCKSCNNKGYKVLKKIKEKNKTINKYRSEISGRIRDQLRYDNKEAFQPHNRDYNDLRGHAVTWNELEADKAFLGRPSLF